MHILASLPEGSEHELAQLAELIQPALAWAAHHAGLPQLVDLPGLTAVFGRQPLRPPLHSAHLAISLVITIAACNHFQFCKLGSYSVVGRDAQSEIRDQPLSLPASIKPNEGGLRDEV